MLDLSQDVRDVLTSKLLCDFGFFVRYLFKNLYNKKFIYSPHIQKIVETMEAVARGDIRRLIINIPPRYGKTEIAVKMFMTWCLANNPKARFMHLSFSDSLVKDNSDAVRDRVKSELFQELFPKVIISGKTDSKGKWYTTEGGGVYAVSTGAPITGFGAGIFGKREYTGSGSPADGFGGAIIIDDPLKPADANSEIKRETVNLRFNNTIRSRLNSEETPIIVIMQRLHEHDLAGFLAEGGSGDIWDNLILKAEDENGSPLWAEKHSKEDLAKMRLADPQTYAAQYMQSPVTPNGNVFKNYWIKYYTKEELPPIFDKKFQSWDFTFDSTAGSDNVCGQLWGKSGANFYLLHNICRRMTFVESIQAMAQMSISFPDAIAKYVEKKANGAAIINTLSQKISGIIAVTPTESKIARAHAVTPLFEAGNIYIPKDAPWAFGYVDELTKFPNAEHDDQVDATTQGLSQNMENNSIWNFL